jgi:hypothetical protein
MQRGYFKLDELKDITISQDFLGIESRDYLRSGAVDGKGDEMIESKRHYSTRPCLVKERYNDNAIPNFTRVLFTSSTCISSSFNSIPVLKRAILKHH